ARDARPRTGATRAADALGEGRRREARVRPPVLQGRRREGPRLLEGQCGQGRDVLREGRGGRQGGRASVLRRGAQGRQALREVQPAEEGVSEARFTSSSAAAPAASSPASRSPPSPCTTSRAARAP